MKETLTKALDEASLKNRKIDLLIARSVPKWYLFLFLRLRIARRFVTVRRYVKEKSHPFDYVKAEVYWFGVLVGSTTL